MKKAAFTENWTCNGTSVIVPHDAMIHEKRTADAAGGSAHGYFPGGIYTYEKKFFIPAEWKEKYLAVEFEGVYKNAEVFLNGKKVQFPLKKSDMKLHDGKMMGRRIF